MATVLYLIFTALQIVDALTTSRILHAGGRELNIIMNSCIARIGIDGTLILVKAAIIAFGLFFTDHTLLMFGLDLFYAIIVANNVRVMRKMRLI